MRVTFLTVLLAASLSAEELFIPVVVQKQGQEGAWWNTEVWVVNTTGEMGRWGAVFLPAGQPNGELLRQEPEFFEELPGWASTVRTDLVPQGGLGALRLVTSPGVVAVARVYNASGRVSSGQFIPALPRDQALRRGEVVHLVGLRRSAQFRTNLLLFAPGPEGVTVRLRTFGERGEVYGEQAYGLAPGALLPLEDILLAFGVQRTDAARAEVSGSGPFFALASVVDSRSGAASLAWPLRPGGPR
ncbi:MAG: hypothetical protein NZ869_02955 [Thermoanaerobaculum sp.]|nr:hypothetical protein [Thermoanaerobaculum sp.]MCX7894945.1 hypothetical protein [Thermoanaerobaculum sp.]MDW7967564.1 hypothetical protein [Thermoanaerobaculum sp.]